MGEGAVATYNVKTIYTNHHEYLMETRLLVINETLEKGEKE